MKWSCDLKYLLMTATGPHLIEGSLQESFLEKSEDQIKADREIPNFDLFGQDVEYPEYDLYENHDYADYIDNGYMEILEEETEMGWFGQSIHNEINSDQCSYLLTNDQRAVNKLHILYLGLFPVTFFVSVLMRNLIRPLKLQRCTNELEKLPRPLVEQGKGVVTHRKRLNSGHNSTIFELTICNSSNPASEAEDGEGLVSTIEEVKEEHYLPQLVQSEELISSFIMGNDTLEKLLEEFEIDRKVDQPDVQTVGPSNNLLGETPRPESRYYNDFVDEMVNRKKLIELSPSSCGSLDAKDIDHQLLSPSTSPVNITLLSDDITNVISDQNDMIQGELENFLDLVVDPIEIVNIEFEPVFKIDLEPNERNVKEMSRKYTSDDIFQINTPIGRPLDSARNMAGIVKNFTSDDSSLDEKIEYFEALSGQRLNDATVSSPENVEKVFGGNASTSESTTQSLSSSNNRQVLSQLTIPNEKDLTIQSEKPLILKTVFETSSAFKRASSSSPNSKIPLASKEKNVGRIIRSPRPKSQSQQKFKITDDILKYFLNSKEPEIEDYLKALFGSDPNITINLNLLEALSKENIDSLLEIYKGRETSENWKERCDNLDILIAHIRLREPCRFYSYFEEGIFDVVEDILGMVSTSRSKLQEKVIIFTRELAYYGSSFSLNDESFVSLVHLLIPLTKSTSKFIAKLSLKSLCLMVQSVNIKTFRRIFNLMCSDILSNRKLKFEKYSCLFLIKFFLAVNFKKIDQVDTQDIIDKLLPYAANLAIDSFQKTRAELVEIYLIMERREPAPPNLVQFFESFSTFLRHKLKNPEHLKASNRV